MDNNSPSMLKATMIGGSVMGVAGGLPIIGALNCACCILIVGGGFLAAFLYSKECVAAGVAFRPGNGAVVGLVAGLFYTIAGTIVSGIIQLIMPTDPEQVMEMLEGMNMDPEQMEMAEQVVGMMGGGGGILFAFFFTLLLAAVFSTIGGLIGAAVFKHEPPAQAPPVPDFVPSKGPNPPTGGSDPQGGA